MDYTFPAHFTDFAVLNMVLLALLLGTWIGERRSKKK